eukprot:198655_1
MVGMVALFFLLFLATGMSTRCDHDGAMQEIIASKIQISPNYCLPNDKFTFNDNLYFEFDLTLNSYTSPTGYYHLLEFATNNGQTQFVLRYANYGKANYYFRIKTPNNKFSPQFIHPQRFGPAYEGQLFHHQIYITQNNVEWIINGFAPYQTTKQPHSVPSNLNVCFPYATTDYAKRSTGKGTFQNIKFRSCSPTDNPTVNPLISPSNYPSDNPTVYPTISPTKYPSDNPTVNPSVFPTKYPSDNPTTNPSVFPSNYPTVNPTVNPSMDVYESNNYIGIAKLLNTDKASLFCKEEFNTNLATVLEQNDQTEIETQILKNMYNDTQRHVVHFGYRNYNGNSKWIHGKCTATDVIQDSWHSTASSAPKNQCGYFNLFYPQHFDIGSCTLQRYFVCNH